MQPQSSNVFKHPEPDLQRPLPTIVYTSPNEAFDELPSIHSQFLQCPQLTSVLHPTKCSLRCFAKASIAIFGNARCSRLSTPHQLQPLMYAHSINNHFSTGLTAHDCLHLTRCSLWYFAQASKANSCNAHCSRLSTSHQLQPWIDCPASIATFLNAHCLRLPTSHQMQLLGFAQALHSLFLQRPLLSIIYSSQNAAFGVWPKHPFFLTHNARQFLHLDKCSLRWLAQHP